MVDEIPDEINAPDEDGNTATMIAAARGYAEIVEYLIRMQADPNIQIRLGEDAPGTPGGVPSETEGQTALHMAAQFGRMDVISVLLLSNCDSTIKDDGGWDAAQLADSEEQNEAKYLLEDWAADEVATRKRLEQEQMLSKASEGQSKMAEEIKAQVEDMVKDLMRPLQEQMEDMRIEMDGLADKIAEETDRSEKAQSDIQADLDALQGKVVTQAEFDELSQQATGTMAHDLATVKTRLQKCQDQVAALNMSAMQQGFDQIGVGSPR